jgi:hypothetical protein
MIKILKLSKRKDKYFILAFFFSLIMSELLSNHILDINDIIRKLSALLPVNLFFDLFFLIIIGIISLIFYFAYLPYSMLMMLNEQHFHLDIHSELLMRVFSILFYLTIYLFVLYSRYYKQKKEIEKLSGE